MSEYEFEFELENVYDGKLLLQPMHYGEVAMGSWTQEFSTFEREIYLEYLDTDKMGGKVEKSI